MAKKTSPRETASNAPDGAAQDKTVSGSSDARATADKPASTMNEKATAAATPQAQVDNKASTATSSTAPGSGANAKTTPAATPNPAASAAVASKASTTSPASAKAPEAKAAETKSADTKPADKKPTETKPAATKPPAATSAPQAPQAKSEVIVKKRGGFFPLLLGGLAAGGIGYGAATYQHQQQATAMPDISEMAARLDDLTQKVGAITPVDLSGIETSQSDLSQKIDTLSAGLSDADSTLAALKEQIEAIKSQPAGTAAAVLPEEAVDKARAAIETDLEGLKAQVAALATEAKERAAEAQKTKQDAVAAEREATIRGALAQMNVAVETGAPFAQELSLLSQNGVTIDPKLQALAADGVPTKAKLAEMFPEAAREALAAARKSGADASADQGVLSFFKSQLGARSLEPQEGNSADAILSRAEADVNAGDLNKALAETEALPDPAKEPLATWRDTAQTRLDALAALKALNETQN